MTHIEKAEMLLSKMNEDYNVEEKLEILERLSDTLEKICSKKVKPQNSELAKKFKNQKLVLSVLDFQCCLNAMALAPYTRVRVPIKEVFCMLKSWGELWDELGFDENWIKIQQKYLMETVLYALKKEYDDISKEMKKPL